MATELLKSRQRSGQRGHVDVEVEGQPTEEPPADTRPDVNQILETVVPAQSVLAPICEESDSMDTMMPEIAESGPEIRPHQPESEPGSELVDRNVRPVTHLDEVENSQSTTQARGDVGQTPDEVHVENPTDAASSILSPYPLISASSCLTVLPVETEFDSKAQAVVHGSVDAVTGQDSTTFEAIEGMAVFDGETQAFWEAPRPKDKSGVVYDELSETDKKKFDASRLKTIDNLLKLNALSVMFPEESDHFAETTPENIIPTNMLDKWKLQDDGTVAAKNRSVLVGWKDPMMYQLERAAPTPTQEGVMVTVQWLASAKVAGRTADLTNAFGQVRKTSRKNKLATKLHPGVTHPKVGPRLLLHVETEIHGLVSGPSWLRAILTVDLLAAGHVKKSVRQMLVHILLFWVKHRKANCCSLTISQKAARKLTVRPWRDSMTSIVVVRRSASGRQDKRAHASPGGASCKNPIFASLCRWTKMSSPRSVPLKFQKDACQTPRR